VTRSAIPGSPLAKARQAAHRAFDTSWQSGKCSRTDAYIWLAQQLNISVKKCHMLQFDVAMCERVISICARANQPGQLFDPIWEFSAL